MEMQLAESADYQQLRTCRHRHLEFVVVPRCMHPYVFCLPLFSFENSEINDVICFLKSKNTEVTIFPSAGSFNWV